MSYITLEIVDNLLKTLNVRAERLVIPLQYQYNRSKRFIIIIPDSYFRHGNATRDEDRKPETLCVCAWRTDYCWELMKKACL
jgi:hypothetical protein